MIFKLVGDPLEAEELTQDAFVRAYLGLDGFRQEARFGTWLVQIGLHAVRDHVRKARRARDRGQVSLESLPGGRDKEEIADAGRATDPLSRLDERETCELVQGALQRLPHEYREVIVLKHFENRPYAEIARLTECSVGTLKVRAHRARRLLRQELMASEPAGARPGLKIAPLRKEVQP
jgi:RNA polymerase sigma-70 factor (ECF subfamily)